MRKLKFGKRKKFTHTQQTNLTLCLRALKAWNLKMCKKIFCITHNRRGLHTSCFIFEIGIHSSFLQNQNFLIKQNSTSVAEQTTTSTFWGQRISRKSGNMKETPQNPHLAHFLEVTYSSMDFTFTILFITRWAERVATYRNWKGYGRNRLCLISRY